MSDKALNIEKVPAGRELAPDMWHSLFGRSARWPALNRLFDFEPFFNGNGFAITTPAVDVSEDDKAFKIAAELPGLDEKNIEVSVIGDTLVLKGEKTQEKEEKGKNWLVSERSYGSFQRRFELPDDVDRDHIDAAFAKGVLTLTLPKTTEAQKKQKKIAIKAS
jgi:HSP20 family protein